jgi:hypothetical protein
VPVLDSLNDGFEFPPFSPPRDLSALPRGRNFEN